MASFSGLFFNLFIILSVWSWNVSYAHFNPAFSLAAMFVCINKSNIKEMLLKVVGAIVCQGLGAILALGLMFAISKVDETQVGDITTRTI